MLISAATSLYDLYYAPFGPSSAQKSPHLLRGKHGLCTMLRYVVLLALATSALADVPILPCGGNVCAAFFSL